MKKILNTAIVCALALFLLSISDVFAANMKRLLNKEFTVNGLAKKYDATGAYVGSGQISQGILLFGEPAAGAFAAHNIASDLLLSVGGLREIYSIIELGPYTIGANRIKSTECTVGLYDAAGTLLVDPPFSGSCDATIKFTSNTAFTGTIIIPDFWGTDISYVLTLNGKYAGTWGVSPLGTSLLEGLKNSAPEGFRKFLQK
jgi:hypothetical protein